MTITHNSFGNQLMGIFKTMRPKQWIKNGFVFVPLFFDRKLFSVTDFIQTAAGFLLFALISGSVYIINDIADIEADKAHPTKCNRPLPSGQLTKGMAIGAAVLIIALCLPAAYFLNTGFAAILAGYLVLQISYSFRLKHIVLIDVMAISAGFLLRVAGGVLLVEVARFSPWLYLFTGMLTLFLGFAKRRQEIILMDKKSSKSRRSLDGYNTSLLDEMIVIVTAVTILTYSLYTFSAEGLPDNHAMMLTIPFVLYGIFRYLQLIHVEGETAPPDEVALRDRPMQLTLLLFGITSGIVLYLS